jgi:hypothetical protein
MSGPPTHGDYDPRRLFPFGLSPIPEVPSELASEVSSVYSYYEEEEEEELESEEEVRSPTSIMYSGQGLDPIPLHLQNAFVHEKHHLVMIYLC